MTNQVVVPRLNANEDRLLLSAMIASVGDYIQADETVFVVESSKATFEVTVRYEEKSPFHLYGYD